MTALGLVLTSIVSTLLFREQISMLRLAGIVLMVMGVFLVSRT
jgi:multidrug transporter EmrE-like cation transporter